MMDESSSCSWYDPSCSLAWIKDEFQAFGLWIYDSILSGLASLFELMPAPEFMINLTPHTIPSGVAWAVAPFQLEYGLGIIVSAYIARFILRRIPGIG